MAALSFPIVVVPDGRLWVAQFDADGMRMAEPVMTDRCSYFVGRSYSHRSVFTADAVTLSHLEFVTLTGLSSLVQSVCGSDD